MVTREPALKLLNEGRDRWVPGIQQQNLLSGDDSLDVLQVYHDRLLTTQHSRRVRQQRIQDPKVPGGQTRSPHDGVLAGLNHLSLACGIQQEPRSYSSAFLPETSSSAADGEAYPGDGWSYRVGIILRRHVARFGWVGKLASHGWVVIRCVWTLNEFGVY